MGFPITVGNKTFTSQDFEGRNYVYGYPELLKAFESRDASSPEFLGVTLNQKIVPAYGRIKINTPMDVTFVPGMVLDLEAPDGSYMGVFVEEIIPQGILGQVCFLSENLTKVHSVWKLGLAQVYLSNTYPGSLESRWKWFPTTGLWGSESGFNSSGNTVGPEIGRLIIPSPPGPVRNLVRVPDRFTTDYYGLARNSDSYPTALEGFRYNHMAGPALDPHHFSENDFIIRWSLNLRAGHPSDTSSEENLEIGFGSLTGGGTPYIVKVGTTLYGGGGPSTGTPLAGVHSNTDILLYQFVYTSSTQQMVFTRGAATYTHIVPLKYLQFTMFGKFNMQGFRRDVYYV